MVPAFHFIDRWELDGLCGQCHLGSIYFPDAFLVPNVARVQLQAQVRFSDGLSGRINWRPLDGQEHVAQKVVSVWARMG